jgi:hypothetical protein
MIRFLCLLLASGFISSVSVSAQTADSAAHVYIYRPHNKLLGNALRPTLSCGPQKFAKLPNGKYLEIDLAPGKCLLRVADGRFLDEHPMELVAGKTYYVRLLMASSTTSVLVGTGAHLQLDDMNEDEARTAMAKLKPVSPDKIKSLQ